MDPKLMEKGKLYVVSFPDGNKVLRMKYKSDFYFKGNGPFWYFHFESRDKSEHYVVKTKKRVLKHVEDTFDGGTCL